MLALYNSCAARSRTYAWMNGTVSYVTGLKIATWLFMIIQTFRDAEASIHPIEGQAVCLFFFGMRTLCFTIGLYVQSFL